MDFQFTSYSNHIEQDIFFSRSSNLKLFIFFRDFSLIGCSVNISNQHIDGFSSFILDNDEIKHGGSRKQQNR